MQRISQKNNKPKRRLLKCDVLIVEIKQVGEIRHVTNVINHYTKKTVKVNLQIVNVMAQMNKYGYRNNLQKHRCLHSIFCNNLQICTGMIDDILHILFLKNMYHHLKLIDL